MQRGILLVQHCYDPVTLDIYNYHMRKISISRDWVQIWQGWPEAMGEVLRGFAGGMVIVIF